MKKLIKEEKSDIIMNPNKVFLFGLDNAGKSTLLHAIKTDEVIEGLPPTRSFSIEEVILKDIEFRIWDAPGQNKLRKTWGKGMDSANIMMFVLDTADRHRFSEAKAEFDTILNDSITRSIPLLFCFNKMDLPSAQENYQFALNAFRLNLILERQVFIHQTSIKTSSSIQEIKDRLVELVEKGRW